MKNYPPPPPPPGPPCRQIKAGFLGDYETQESKRRLAEYKIFMVGYRYALGLSDKLPKGIF